MQIVYGKVAGIDVHKKMLAVVVRDRTAVSERDLQQRKFGTTTSELQALREWLAEQQVSEVVMESTAQYWKPVWLELEGHCGLHLAQARSTGGMPGRKRDFADAQRMIRRLLSGDIILSYVPDGEQRQWRLLERSRTQLIEDRTRVRNQLECILEEARIKLSSVVSDLLGVSSRRILKALVKAKDDLQVVVARAAEHLRATPAELEEALRGQMQECHRQLLQMALDRIELLDRQIADLDAQLGIALHPYQPQIERLCGVPGISVTAAQQIIAEVGPYAVVFPSAGHLASWVGVCPGREESAGRSRTDRCPKGNRALRRLLVQIAFAAVRQKDSFFQCLFRRLVPRLGVNKAIWAVAHRMLKVIWKILHDRVSYEERGAVPPNPKSIQRRKQRLIRELRQFGYKVVPA
jgi:transposase